MPSIGTPREWQADAPLDPTAWVPVSSLALEGFGASRIDDTIEARTRRLARDLAAEVLLDDIGRACVPRAVAREMFAERAERDQQAREKAAATAAANGSEVAAMRARLKRIAERQADVPDVTAEHGMPASAVAKMTAADHAARVEKHSSHMDDMLSGGLKYHPIRREGQE